MSVELETSTIWKNPLHKTQKTVSHVTENFPSVGTNQVVCVPVFSSKKDGEPNTHGGENEKKKDPHWSFWVLVGDDASLTTLQWTAAYHLLF